MTISRLQQNENFTRFYNLGTRWAQNKTQDKTELN